MVEMQKHDDIPASKRMMILAPCATRSLSVASSVPVFLVQNNPCLAFPRCPDEYTLLEKVTTRCLVWCMQVDVSKIQDAMHSSIEVHARAQVRKNSMHAR